MTAEPATAEEQDWERANRAEMDRLNAMPWRGGCRVCPGRLWCTDTEEEARRLVSEHIASEHVLTPDVWRDHDDPAPVLEAADGEALQPCFGCWLDIKRDDDGRWLLVSDVVRRGDPYQCIDHQGAERAGGHRPGRMEHGRMVPLGEVSR